MRCVYCIWKYLLRYNVVNYKSVILISTSWSLLFTLFFMSSEKDEILIFGYLDK